jgi:hypothetical protein
MARYRMSPKRRSTRPGEPVRQVVAAWIVAAFVLLGGVSVLTFHERSARDYGPPGVALRWHSPPVAEADETDERLCCSGIRACQSELPAVRDCDDWMISQFRSGSASMCSSDDYGGARELADCC